MALVTPARLRAIYTMLLHMPPFIRWQMPHPDTVKFYLVHDPKINGEYSHPHRIGINPETCSDLPHIERVMAHEMVHMRQELIGRRPATKDDQHNREFYRLARIVCRNLGYASENF
jgi:hypothetical protein